MNLDEKAVARIANLARIKVPAEERAALGQELSKIMGWIEELSEVDTDGIEPLSSVAHMALPMRHDVVSDGQRAGEILQNAPSALHGYFTVPKVVE